MARFATRRFTTALVAAAAAAGSLLGVTGTAFAAPVTHSVTTAPVKAPTATPAAVAMENQFLGLLNAHRIANHDKPLTVSPDLVALSLAWSAKMASTNTLSHDPNLAAELSKEPTGWKTAGQNVGDGSDVLTLDKAFWASPLHKYNELYPAFTQVGIGVVIVKGTVWVTFDFRQPTTTVAPVKHAATARTAAVHSKKATHSTKVTHVKKATKVAKHHRKHHHRKHHA